MFYSDYIAHIVSSKADYRLFTNVKYQNKVDNAIQTLLDREPLTWRPDTLLVDADKNMVTLFDQNDRANTERTISL